MNEQKQRARQVRALQTKSEGLLRSILRGKQLCGLKFRRQHPIGPDFADFDCVSKKLVIEIDGGYHGYTAESDLQREKIIRKFGWDVIRFSDDQVEDDPEAVAIAIAKQVGLRYEFEKRKGLGSGMLPKSSPRDLEIGITTLPKEGEFDLVKGLNTRYQMWARSLPMQHTGHNKKPNSY